MKSLIMLDDITDITLFCSKYMDSGVSICIAPPNSTSTEILHFLNLH